METQKMVILKYLENHKRGISQAQAAQIHIYDLAGVIRNLRNEGHNIDYERMSVKDDDGKERTFYHRYFLRRQ